MLFYDKKIYLGSDIVITEEELITFVKDELNIPLNENGEMILNESVISSITDKMTDWTQESAKTMATKSKSAGKYWKWIILGLLLLFAGLAILTMASAAMAKFTWSLVVAVIALCGSVIALFIFLKKCYDYSGVSSEVNSKSKDSVKKIEKYEKKIKDPGLLSKLGELKTTMS